MKREFSYFLLFFLGFLFIPQVSFAASDNLTAVQITFDTIQISGQKANDEFVRLINHEAVPVELTGFKLTKKSLSGGECKESVLVSQQHFTGIILSGGLFTIAHQSYKEAIHADLDYSSASYYLSQNTSVLLYDKTGALVDRIASGTACDEAPLPPDDPEEPASPQIPIVTHVRINEILPNPANKGEEFIELYNDSDTPADLSAFSLHDASQSGEYIFPSQTLIPAHGYLIFLGSISKIALNNSNETLSLFDNTHALIDSMSYKTGREGVSINFTENGWRGGVPTPGASNQLNTLPETKEKVPKEGYRGMPVAFDARGKDADGSPLKYTWDFGDGHKSYLGKTSHTYEENGMYQVTLKTTDGSDDVIETFSIKISSFPKLDIRITSLVPNPAGKDSENEWLVIENREKKTIDLEGWSIATGWDNMVNHPIREHLVVGAKSQIKLTREFSLFTLPNKKGRIELRAPNGKVLQEIEYKEEKSIPEDAVYYKEKGKRWSWKKKAEENVATPTISESALSETETAPQEILEASPLESSVLPEEKSTDPKAAHLQTIDQETLRREFYRLLHQHAWVDVSNTPSPKSFSPSPSSLLLKLRSLLSQTNATLNDWQNEK